MKQFLLRTIKITALIVPVVLFLMLIPYSSPIETSRIRNFCKEERDTPIRKESGRLSRPLQRVKKVKSMHRTKASPV